MKRKRGGFYCAHKGCQNVSGRDNNISFFRFPKDAERSAAWLAACGREDLLNKSSDELYSNYRVCQVHFDNHMFLNDLKNRLQSNACPRASTLNTHKETQLEENIEISDKGENIIHECFPSQVDSAINNTTTCLAGSMDISSHSVSTEASINNNESVSLLLELSDNIINDKGNSKNHSNQLNKEQAKSTESVGTQTEQKLSKNTPRKMKLRKRIESLKKKVLRLGKKRISRCKRKAGAVKLDDVILTSEQINRLVDKTVSEEAAEFVKAQINHTQQKPQGKRYSKEFKQFCLNLYYSGPKAYKAMRKSFQLISIRSLQRLTRKVNLRPGVHKNIFEALKLKVEHLSDRDKHCTLCVDEMSLKAFLNHDAKTDEVVGLEDSGNGKRMKPACNAMVGMLRGISQPWKEQVFYNLLHSQCSFQNIRDNVVECIRLAKEIGLTVVAVISDMGSNFVQLSHSLRKLIF